MSHDLQQDRAHARAFVAVRAGDRSWVIDLTEGASTIGRAQASTVRLEDPQIAPKVAVLLWNGDALMLEDAGSNTPVFVNGKDLTGRQQLEPGDEIAIGSSRLVIGIAMPPSLATRRVLTHHEFLERVNEELARARRSGNPTTLVMVQARHGEGATLSATAAGMLRAGDVVGTYAHDEIELLLADTPADTARAVVERILQAATTHAFIGLAVAPVDGDHPDRLVAAARAALARARREGASFERALSRPPAKITPVAEDPRTRSLVELIYMQARSQVPVLFTGEASVGKGVFGRLLHEASFGSAAPFVIVACTALRSEEALKQAEAAADEARGGTLVLDEVGDTPLESQAALTTLLKTRQDALRLVATTHRDLDALVGRRAFDAGLLASVRGAVVEIPPLRERPADIVPLAETFAVDFGARTPVPFSPGALARLRSYAWPGNVLELRNAIERAVRLADGDDILAEHLPSDSLPVVSGEGRLREHVDSIERDAIIKALAENNHNQTHAAKRLGISRRALIYKMEKYGLKSPPSGTRKR